jgi:hypothetical protein
VATCVSVRSSMYANYRSTYIRVNMSYSSVVAYRILECCSTQSCTFFKYITQVRLFEATLPNGERALLKEFPPQAADLASNELAMHKQVSAY